MQVIKKLFVVLVIPLFFSAPVLAVKCEGNACDDVTVHFNNGCYVAKNYSTKRIKVKLGNVSKVLQRNETHKFIIAGKCFNVFKGRAKANYVK